MADRGSFAVTMQRAVTGLHTRVIKATGGRIGARLGTVEVVLVTTVGRRSGRPRVTPLNGTPDGDRLLLVASNGGATRHPDWYLNLVERPDITVQRSGRDYPMRARTATPQERERMWPLVVAGYSGYTGYQTKTDRTIPVVVCEPR